MGGLRRALERQAGAHEFAFDLDTGVGTLTIDPTEQLNLSEFHGAIREAGFEFGWTELSVAAAFLVASMRDGALLLRGESSLQQIWLLPGDAEETKRAFVEIGRWAGEGTVIRVRGRAHVHADGSVAVEPREFETVGAHD